MKISIRFVFFILLSFAVLALSSLVSTVEAGWVNGYWRSDGTYVPGYWRSDPNGLKYDNYSFDGDWSDAYNDSYFNSDKNYSSDWYTPSWITQDDYWTGKYFYDQRNSYKDYHYNLFDYDYDFWDDPIYDYSPSYDYDYDYDYLDFYSTPYTSPYSTPYLTPYFTPYSTPYYSPYYTPYRYDPPSYFDYDYNYDYDYEPYNYFDYP